MEDYQAEDSRKKEYEEGYEFFEKFFSFVIVVLFGGLFVATILTICGLFFWERFV